MQVVVAEILMVEGIGMQHKHDIFTSSKEVRKMWTRPKLTCTKLSDAELQEALSSTRHFRGLGLRLRSEGRI